jgi:hypothetical protein
MNKTVVTSVGILAVAAVVSVMLYGRATRYVMVDAGDGTAYKVDRQTGESVLLTGTREIPLERIGGVTAIRPPETLGERAIRLAKEAHTVDFADDVVGSNESKLRRFAGEQTGELRILGWQAQRVDDQVFLVQYSVRYGGRTHVWGFEVNLAAGFVRNVNGDRELESKYGLKATRGED